MRATAAAQEEKRNTPDTDKPLFATEFIVWAKTNDNWPCMTQKGCISVCVYSVNVYSSIAMVRLHASAARQHSLDAHNTTR